MLGLRMGLGFGGRGLASAYTVSAGDGIGVSPTIVSAGGSNWTVTATGVPGSPWTVTTTQLDSGLPILMTPQVVTETAGPVFEVEAGDEPVFLCPTADLAEYVYEWYRNTSTLVGSGRIYDATADTGLLVESVITAHNGATADAGTPVESRVEAQEATPYTEPDMVFSNQRLSRAGGFGALTEVTHGFLFTAPATFAVTQTLFHGDTAFGLPHCEIRANGVLQMNVSSSSAVSSTGVIIAGHKYAVLVSADATHFQMVVKDASAAFSTKHDLSPVGQTISSSNVAEIGNASAFGDQFTGHWHRFFAAPERVDVTDLAVQNAFVDAACNGILPSVFRALFASYLVDFAEDAEWRAGTHTGTLGSFTLTGSAFP